MTVALKDQFGTVFQMSFVAFMLRDSSFLDRVADDVRDAAFLDEVLGRIVKIILSFRETYSTSPDKLIYQEIDNLRDRSLLSNDAYKAILHYLDALFAEPLSNREYLLSNFESFIRYSKLERCIPELIELAQDGQWDRAEKVLAKIFSETRSKNLISSNYSDNVETRIERRQKQEEFSLMHIPELDQYIQVHRGVINAVQSRASSDGKTAFLVHLARYYLYTGNKVLLVTLEEPVQAYEDRMDMCLCDMTYEEIKQPENQEIQKLAVKRYTERGGSLKIHQMIPSKATISDIDKFIASQIATENWIPDVLLLDYADRCAPETTALKARVWDAHEEIYNALDALAKERNLYVWTAMQSNRSALTDQKAYADQEHTSGGLIKQQIARLVISINRAGKDVGPNQARLRIVKNTFGPKDESVIIHQDYSRGQFRIDPRKSSYARS